MGLSQEFPWGTELAMYKELSDLNRKVKDLVKNHETTPHLTGSSTSLCASNQSNFCAKQILAKQKQLAVLPNPTFLKDLIIIKMQSKRTAICPPITIYFLILKLLFIKNKNF